MSKSQTQTTPLHLITPPLSFSDAPTPPLSDERFIQAPRILSIFKDLHESRPVDLGPWTTFQLVEGEFEEFERQLRRDDDLWGFTDDKIRYDYDPSRNRLVLRRPSRKHEVFNEQVKLDIIRQLDRIANGADQAASFARRILSLGDSDLFFPYDDGPEAKKCPDTEMIHEDAEYPGLIMEISYSQKRKDIPRLADIYLLGSKGSVNVVVGLDIEYGPRASHEATLSVWRLQTDQGAKKYRVVMEVENECFRDRYGRPTNSPGLQLRLSEFAPLDMARIALAGDDRDITISAQQLSEYLTYAERIASQTRARRRRPFNPEFEFERMASTPPDQITPDDEAALATREDADAERADDADPDWVDPASPSTSRQETGAGRRRSNREG